MLVFISDLHMTDGSTGATLEPGAAERFGQILVHMAEHTRAEELHLVLLGDILDLTRSRYWLKSSIRPWSAETQRDPIQHSLRQTATEIVDRICRHPDNRRTVAQLRRLQDELTARGIRPHMTYLPGNTDALVNRYPEARTRVAGFLGLANPIRFESHRFDAEGFWPEYRAMARHGHRYDPLHYDGEQSPSCLGDAIVIELLTRLPVRVAERLGDDADGELIANLQEIDFVRPLVDAPLVVRGACLNARTPEAVDCVKVTWNEIVDEFLQVPFVCGHEVPWRLDMVDVLRFGLKLNRYLSIRDIESMPLRRLQGHLGNYHEQAFNEPRLRNGEVDHVVYAHTHEPEVHPLEVAAGNARRIHFNVGTWRKVYRRAEEDRENFSFLSWHALSVLALYLPAERSGRPFEMWTGSLGAMSARPRVRETREVRGEYTPEAAEQTQRPRPAPRHFRT